jgi:hypothetical protein
MWQMRQMETMQRLRAEREALQPPPPPPRRRGRPSNAELAARLTPELIAKTQARLIELADLDSPVATPRGSSS